MPYVRRNADGEIIGAFMLQQSTAAILSLRNQGLSRLITLTLIAMVVVAAGLLGYASLLSWRIRRLSRSVSNAIGEDGAVSAGFTPGRSADDLH